MVVEGDGQLMRKNFFAIVHFLKTWRHYLGLCKAKVYTDNVSLKYLEIQMQVNAKSLRWHHNLALMDVDLIPQTGPSPCGAGCIK